MFPKETIKFLEENGFKRWTRNNKDRLYYQRIEKKFTAYIDLETGEIHTYGYRVNHDKGGYVREQAMKAKIINLLNEGIRKGYERSI